jgi:TolA-binding protein
MIFQWRWILILPALILSGEIALAAGSAKEQRAFAAAVGAFNDRMYPHAEAEFGQFQKDYPDSTNAPMAVLLETQSEFKQREFSNAIALLNDTNNLAKAGTLADQYFYWTGEAQFTNGDFSSAAETFVSLSQNFPQSPLRLRAVVEAASAYVRLGKWTQTVKLLEETNGVFQGAVELDPGNELVSRGRLLLAQANFALKDFAGEFAVLTSLNPQTLKPELGWQRAYLLCQNREAAGDFGAALAAATNLLQIAPPGNDAALHAESVAMHADALEKSGFTNEAIAAYQENLTNSAPVEQQRQAALKISELAMAQTQIQVATNALETFLAQFPNSPAADVVALTLGELDLKNYAAQPMVATNDLPEARARFDQFIGAFTNSPLAGRAHLDRGWCDWIAATNFENIGDLKVAAQEYSDSFDDFSAAAQSPDFPPEDMAVARFKMGDVLFAQKNFAGARNNYESVVNDFTNFPAVGESLGAQALYQLLRVCLQLNDVNGAHNSLARILQIYPANGFATNTLLINSILIAGEGLTDLGQPTNALALFEKFKQLSPGSDLLPEVDLAMARAYEQEGDWPSAIGVYEDWVKQFGTNAALLPSVEYARAWANFQAGDETKAFQLFTNFIAQFPASALAPVAQWWVGDHFFRAGDFVDAERNYKYVFQNWPTNILAPDAKMMAGRAAMGRGGYQDAISYFTSLTLDTNCPPDLDAQALFAYGSVLMQMPSSDTNRPLANFDQAIPVFKTIGQKYPANKQAALAQGEIGDCYLQLTNYAAATNAYAQVVNSTNASVAARSQAQIGIGLALEKMAVLATDTNQVALLNQAQGNYYDVFKGNNLRTDSGEEAYPFWQKEAGKDAERLAEYLQEWKTAFAYYRDMTNNWPSLQPVLENKIKKLLQEHPEAAQN